MILKNLKIELIPSYRPNAGQYEGVAVFTNQQGDIALNLTPEHCEKIFLVCADGIVSVAKEAAKNLTCAVLEHKILLESK